ncbi:hypothetical protein KY320_03975 [Candidatus Woesearchaeota archaeon]|nr:hypothetical protein [Candidatus Woesearchaeota archaeon]
MEGSQTTRLLGDVSPEHAFKLQNTSIEIRSIFELKEALEIMSEECFKQHANEKKNDFARWVSEIIKDDMLSNKLVGVTSKKKALKIVSKRIAQLKKQSGDVGSAMTNLVVGVCIGFVLGVVIAVMLMKLFSFVI